MEIIRLITFADQRALEHMQRALEQDLHTVATQMAAAQDLRAIGFLQGRYTLLLELKAAIAAKLKV